MQRPPRLMIVEDNPADLRLAQEVLQEVGLADDLMVARDGEEAIEMLKRQGRFVDAERPDMILLDLNLPKRSGREVLTEVKTDENLRHIPTLILSTSRSESDVKFCYQSHANAYLPKPVELDDFSILAQNIYDFWFNYSLLAPGHEWHLLSPYYWWKIQLWMGDF